MEFSFNCSQLFRIDKQGIGIISGETVPKTNQNLIIYVLDSIGEASSKAQGLKSVITTGSKFINSDHKIYIKCERNKVLGFIKIGRKNLFIRNELGDIKELSPLCVLDFYVHESEQRYGHGKSLFTKMITDELIEPRKMGYDRPSEKLLNFLAKHYSLINYIPQNNNFVVFNDYFEILNRNNLSAHNETKNKCNFSAKNDKIVDFIPKNNNLFKKNSVKYDVKFIEKKDEINIDIDVNSERDLNINYDTSYKRIKKNKLSVSQDHIPSRKNGIDLNNKNKTPWAVNDNSNNFMATSSSYGAYFYIKK